MRSSRARAGEEEAIEPVGMADADMAEPVDDAFIGKDAVRGDEIVED
jgi:hypothetical protein